MLCADRCTISPRTWVRSAQRVSVRQWQASTHTVLWCARTPRDTVLERLMRTPGPPSQHRLPVAQTTGTAAVFCACTTHCTCGGAPVDARPRLQVLDASHVDKEDRLRAYGWAPRGTHCGIYKMFNSGGVMRSVYAVSNLTRTPSPNNAIAQLFKEPEAGHCFTS